MTSEDSMQPLLPTSLVPPPPPHSRRRYHRCKTAPVDVGHEERDGGSLPRFGSILDQIHPSFRQVAMFLSIYVGLGTVCFYLAMNQIEGKKTDGVLDAVYFCIVTMTTVGYGDLVPNSATTKLLACGFCFTGMTLIAMILSKAADYLVEKQETLLVKTLNKHQKDRQRKLVEDIDTHKVRNKTLVVLGLLLLIVITGTIFLVAVEKLNVVDAFYCVCATITTLGYGDKSFSTKAGRVFAIFWIVTGTIVVAQFFLYIAELSTESRRRSLVKWVLSQKMTRVELEAADLDDDGTVSASEFIIYKLKEMGKISQEDVSVVMEEFEKLDVDQSGTLTAADIFLAGQDSFPENGKVKPVDPVTETLVIAELEAPPSSTMPPPRDEQQSSKPYATSSKSESSTRCAVDSEGPRDQHQPIDL